MQLRDIKQMAYDTADGVGAGSYIVGFLGSILTHLKDIETPFWIKVSTILGCIYLSIKIWNELVSGIHSRREYRRKRKAEKATQDKP